jgi:Lrp/AsnC family leucine-responsive transcriptional regulator
MAFAPSLILRVAHVSGSMDATDLEILDDAKALGLDVTAFIGVGIEHPKYFERFATQVMALDEVLECHRVAGQDSYLLKVRTQHTQSLDQLLVEKLRTIPGVTRTQTTIVLASIKEDTRVAPRPSVPGARP